MRFLGGVFACVGLIFLAGAGALARLRSVLLSMCPMIFVGGLARPSRFDASLFLGKSPAPSLVAELALFPLLAFWIFRDGSKIRA